MGETQRLENIGITLQWEKWVPWPSIRLDVRRGGIAACDFPGVYQVRYLSDRKLLYIGESGSGKQTLKGRVNKLVGKDSPHSAGERIRASEDVSKLEVRWAITEWHKKAETELLETHRVQFGSRPKYNKQ